MSWASLNAYDNRDCIKCGAAIRAPYSRMSHVFGMHADRCAIATPEKRLAFRRTGRWPRAALCALCKWRGRRTVVKRRGDSCAACDQQKLLNEIDQSATRTTPEERVLLAPLRARTERGEILLGVALQTLLKIHARTNGTGVNCG